MVNLYIGIDDTDNLDSPGSGVLAEQLSRELQDNGLARCAAVTRHQLLVDDRVAYTSHNSAMCFTAVCAERTVTELISYAQDFLQTNAAIGADPGLSVVVDNGQSSRESLVSFGRKVKRYLVAKDEAYDLAKTLGVHLSEHGGTGIGVIGALAATGLRISGCDGRYRGWHEIGRVGEVTTAGWLTGHDFIDAVLAEDGTWLSESAPVTLTEARLKTVLLDGCRMLPVARDGASSCQLCWKTLSRDMMKRF